ncbi:MAG: hypothetical protein ISQ32_05405 [Rickettsiales bacterium]|nr:hypothetical protein [Rickettsiales bacterium]
MTINKIFCLSGFLIKPELIANSLDQKIDYIDYIQNNENSFFQNLQNTKNNYDLAIGFSLGACLLLKYHNFIKAKKILLIAPPANFISSSKNPFGKPKEEISSFISMLKENFNLLHQKFNFSNSFPRRQIFKELMDHNKYQDTINKSYLLEWLFFLELFDASLYTNCKKEIYIMHGLQDNVVNYQQTSIFKKTFKNVNVKLIEDAPHALFLSHPNQFQEHVNHILNL